MSLVPFFAALSGAVVGGALALAGGLYQEHRRFLRRRRVACRILYDDLLGKIAGCHVDRWMLDLSDDRDGPDPFDTQREPEDAPWQEHRQTLAEERDPALFTAVRDAYEDYAAAIGEPSARLVRHEIAIGDRKSGPIGKSSGQEDFHETREDALEEARLAAERAVRLVGRRAGLAPVEIERSIKDCALPEDDDD